MLKKLLIYWWPIIALFLLVVGIAIKNYESNTLLSGWDNVHHELDLSFAWQRVLSGAWIENWGLGMGSGMAYAADLPRLIMYSVLALFLPVDMIRYVWVFGMLFLGVLGSYQLFRSVFNNKYSAFLGSLFYLFNLATVQYFFTPFVAFVAFYGFLPWLIFVFLQYFQTRKRRDLFCLGVVSFFSAPAFFVQTLFIVFSIVLTVVTVGYLFQKKHSIRVALLGWLVFLVTQLYWLLPTFYYAFNNASVVVQSKINALTTLETQLGNRAYSTVVDIALLKGFWFSYTDAQIGLESGQLMKSWIDHINSVVTVEGLVVFGFVLAGYIYLAFSSKNSWKWTPIALFVIGYLMLVRGEWLSDYIPFFGQVFRSAFTKWSIVMALAYAWGIAAFADWLRYRKRVLLVVFIVIEAAMIHICWPIFRGDLIYDHLKVKIPNDYNRLFSYLKSQDGTQRIAHLPTSWYWGWTYYSWGYRGSGFFWYGIKQPILDRAFDVWSPYNETFYNELSTAFYYCPPEADDIQVGVCAKNVKQVFDKYQVCLALLDESVILPGQDNQVMRYELWKKVLAKLDPEVDFQSGSLSVYTVANNTTGISAPAGYRQIEAETTYGRFDPFYDQNAAYVGARHDSPLFPFANITREDLTKVVEYGESDTIKIKGGLVTEGKVDFPELVQGETIQGRIRATLSETELLIETLPFGELSVGDQNFPWGVDQSLKVELTQPVESLIVDVAGKQIIVSRNSQVEMRGTKLTVGQAIKINVFEGLGQEVLISTPSARLGEFEAGQLIQVLGNQKICLGYEQKNYQCLNSNHSLITPQTGVYWLDVLEDKNNYPKVIIYQPIASYEFPAEVWQQVKREFEVKSRDLPQAQHDPGIEASVTWQMSVEPTNVGEWKKDGGNENCDVLRRGSAKKSVVDDGVLYEATDYGAYCDSWWVGPMISEGVLRLTGENVEGRGIKLSVFSTKEDRTILEQLLPSVGKFDQSYGVLTGLQQGSTINVETKSFGRIEGKNQLDSARFYPVPLTWLQKIKIGNNEIIDNNIEIGDVKKWGTGIYIVGARLDSPENTNNSLLVLNQGFDKGWISPGLRHVKVNGWANGWILNPGIVDPGIVIFYWPQILEWIGLGLLVVGGVAAVLYTRRKR